MPTRISSPSARKAGLVATVAVLAGTFGGIGLARDAAAAGMVGLTAQNQLVAFDSERPRAAAPKRITGLPNGVRMLGIDTRPADGKLYGVGSDGRLYTIVPGTGAATAGARLNQPVPAGQALMVDFNPFADRLRVMATDGTNYRVNVDTGEVAVDGKLNYAAGDAGAGTTPRVVAGAYTNSIPGTKPGATALYNFDDATKAYTVQMPPNDGTQVTRGAAVTAGMSTVQGFDILSPAEGQNTGVALIGRTLYRVDLQNGALTKQATVENLNVDLIDVAFVR